MGRVPTGQLLCIPFLDTDTTKDTALANAELSLRGYPSWLIAALRKVCALGLWYQLIVWEDFHLDLSDVAMGYGAPLVIIGGLVALLANVRHPNVALGGLGAVVVGLALIASGIVGWRSTRKRYAKLFAETESKDDL